jgi:hypothetical protein
MSGIALRMTMVVRPYVGTKNRVMFKNKVRRWHCCMERGRLPNNKQHDRTLARDLRCIQGMLTFLQCRRPQFSTASFSAFQTNIPTPSISSPVSDWNS